MLGTSLFVLTARVHYRLPSL